MPSPDPFQLQDWGFRVAARTLWRRHMDWASEARLLPPVPSDDEAELLMESCNSPVHPPMSHFRNPAVPHLAMQEDDDPAMVCANWPNCKSKKRTEKSTMDFVSVATKYPVEKKPEPHR